MWLRNAILLAGCLAIAPAQDWPQWRGPHRDGVAASFPAPQAWPEKLQMQWKVTVGEGHSSPVTAGGKVYIHTRQGEREVVTCLRPDNGKVLWQEGYDAPYKINYAAHAHGKGVKSTPVVEGGRVFTLGISGILSCFDASTGKPQWRKEFAPATFGTAMSPVVEGGLVIAHVALPGGGGALTAFDVQTGAEKWSWKDDGPAYASPIVVDLAGVRQLVTQSQKRILSISPTNGAPIWQLPFTTAYDQNIITPVLYRDLLIFSGLGNGTFAVRVSRQGPAFLTGTAWRNPETSMYMSTPVVSGDLLYGFADRHLGEYLCLDARTGATLWVSPGRQGENAAIVDVGSALLLLDNDANLTVAGKNGKAFQPLRKYSVAASPTWAHPVPLGSGILIKDATTLALWRLR